MIPTVYALNDVPVIGDSSAATQLLLPWIKPYASETGLEVNGFKETHQPSQVWYPNNGT